MGIVHGDLRPGNVLARQTAGRWEFFFIDNERTRKCRFLSRHLRLKNLVQINMLPAGLTRTDRMRFFQSYMLANPSVCVSYRRWAERIMARTRRRFRRKGWSEVDSGEHPPRAEAVLHASASSNEDFTGSR
jgi:hypothetical protein